MNDLVRTDFCGPGARWGAFSPRSMDGLVSGREVLSNTLYHYTLRDSNDQVVLLQLYEGVSGLGGELWEQEVTVLQRLAALQHPALPRLAHGGSAPADETRQHGVDGYAFIVTDSRGEPLHDGNGASTFSESIAYFGSRIDRAVVQLMSLADGLALLHGMGVAHRNVWPGTVEVELEDGEPVLRLTRFEMSALVSNLLRFASWDGRRRADEARQLVLRQGARALAYFSPDRVRSLFLRDAVARDHPNDVYGLGMMAAEWFTGEMPAALVDATERAMRECGDDPEPVVTAVTRLNRHMHTALGKCHPALRSLIRNMIDLHAPSRPSAGQVVDRLSDHFEALIHGTEDLATRPYLLLFMPDNSSRTLFPWRKIRYDPRTPQGRVELADFIERDLRRARLYHAPSGAVPFMSPTDSDDARAMAESTYLLMGEEVTWFCQEYQPHSAFGGARAKAMDNVLIIKYVVDGDSARGKQVRDAVREQRRYRIVPPVDVHPWDIDQAKFRELATTAPPWSVLMNAVRQLRPPSSAEEKYAAAFDFLLEFQREELEARRYPYVVADGITDPVTLRFDKDRDRRWHFSSAMAMTFAESSRLRPAMGDFFTSTTQSDGEVMALLRADEDGQPARGRAVEVEVLRGQHDVIEVRGGRHFQIPSPGWIEFADDVGTRVALARQRSARWELLRNRSLVEQLDGPSELGRSPLPADATAAAVIERLRTAHPIFALQGPPGTGKTEMAATALRDFLHDQPFARVLVSAQSNYALDNIAERVLDKLGLLGDNTSNAPVDIIALRVTTPDRALSVDETVKPFVLGTLADRTYEQLLHRLEKTQKSESDPVVRDLIIDWAQTVRTSLPELTDRLHRSANLVFATCSAATRRNLNRGVPADTFDWVIVEEAAKAWPTELAIPLVRSGRWCLVGDQKQLPAHRRREIEDFLVRTARSEEEDLRIHGLRHDDYVDVFDLFGHMFNDQRLAPLPRGFTRPRFVLRTQYRMRPAICEVVSRAFYPDQESKADDAPLPPGLLRTGRDDLGIVHRPGPLASSALVWIDTSAESDCEDAPTWTNAGEIRVIEELLRRLHPRPAARTNGYGPHPVAVLSPYRRQVDLMRGRAEIRDHVYTIHAFQGRQADVVVVSLVRDQLRGTPDRPWQSIGHLTQPELVNVLLSRARSHLVLVGSLPHFEQCGDKTWADVCALVRHYGTVVPADGLVG